MIRFYNCSILTDKIIKGELWVDKNKIAYIGDNRKGIFEKEADCRGGLIIPGFKNCHTHSAMTFLRSRADDLPLDKWLNEQVFPMEAKLSAEAAQWFCKLAIMEYLSGGTTGIFDMYFLPEAMAAAAKETGFRTVLCGAVNDFVSSPTELESDFVKYNNYSPILSHRLGFHAEYTTSYERLLEIAELSNKLKQPVYTHCSETKKEVDDCIKKYGKTPIGLFNDIGMFNYGGGIFHGNYISDDDIEILKEKNITVVTNPASNLKLASGICPVERLINRGINMAIGTDGAASNNALDMFREMYLVTVLQKYYNSDASAMAAEKVFEIACLTDMLGSDCSRISEGSLADFAVINMNMPNMQPVNNIIKNLVYSGSKANVYMTVVDGKILYENGKYNIGVSEEEIYRKCNELLKDMT